MLVEILPFGGIQKIVSAYSFDDGKFQQTIRCVQFTQVTRDGLRPFPR